MISSPEQVTPRTVLKNISYQIKHTSTNLLVLQFTTTKDVFHDLACRYSIEADEKGRRKIRTKPMDMSEI